MLKKIKKQLWLFPSLAVICFAASAFADTVSMELIGPPPGPILGGVYTSPYTALVGPAGQTKATITGVATQVICDDFQTDVSINTPPWQAVVTDLSTILNESTTSKVVKFDQTSTVQQQQFDYTVAAYLAIEIMNVDQSTTAGQVHAGELSFAMWGLFDPITDPAGPFSGHFVTGTNLTNAENDLKAAQAAVLNGWTPNTYLVTIYTASPLNASQEYLSVRAPEAATPVLLAVDLLGILSLVAFLRKRKLQTC
jgi:hypothetical protein